MGQHREVIVNAITQEVTERWSDLPDVMTLDQGLVQTAVLIQQESNGRTLEQQAGDALANLRAYRDLSAPTAAQTTAAVKLLCRVAIGLIRMKLAKFDGTD